MDGEHHARADGLIRPEHADEHWRLHGGSRGWSLVRHRPDHIGIVETTTATTCAWRVTSPSGRTLREASAGDDVEGAKTAADAWMFGQWPGASPRGRAA